MPGIWMSEERLKKELEKAMARMFFSKYLPVRNAVGEFIDSYIEERMQQLKSEMEQP